MGRGAAANSSNNPNHDHPPATTISLNDDEEEELSRVASPPLAFVVVDATARKNRPILLGSVVVISSSGTNVSHHRGGRGARAAAAPSLGGGAGREGTTRAPAVQRLLPLLHQLLPAALFLRGRTGQHRLISRRALRRRGRRRPELLRFGPLLRRRPVHAPGGRVGRRVGDGRQEGRRHGAVERLDEELRLGGGGRVICSGSLGARAGVVHSGGGRRALLFLDGSTFFFGGSMGLPNALPAGRNPLCGAIHAGLFSVARNEASAHQPPQTL